MLDTLRIALSLLESDLAVMFVRHLDRPHEAKKLLATIFAAPGTVRVSRITARVGSDSRRSSRR